MTFYRTQSSKKDVNGVIHEPKTDTTASVSSVDYGQSQRRTLSTQAHVVASHSLARLDDPWPQILTSLIQSSSDPICDRTSDESFHRLHASGSRKHSATHDRTVCGSITVEEIFSQTLVSLSWRDATLCNYVEQLWSCGQARTSGRCALSGKVIRKGDLIYRPRLRGKKSQSNDGEMILASELARLECRYSSARATKIETVGE